MYLPEGYDQSVWHQLPEFLGAMNESWPWHCALCAVPRHDERTQNGFVSPKAKLLAELRRKARRARWPVVDLVLSRRADPLAPLSFSIRSHLFQGGCGRYACLVCSAVAAHGVDRLVADLQPNDADIWAETLQLGAARNSRIGATERT